MNLDLGTLMRYRALEQQAFRLERAARSTADAQAVEEYVTEALAVRGRMLQIVRGEI